MAKEKAQKQMKKSATEEKTTKTVGTIATRGRVFQGIVIRKFPKRVTIEFERTVYVPKFERSLRKRTRIHSRLPDSMADSIQLGDLILVQECRPLSKLIHSVVIKKVRSAETNGGKE